jgi:myo-inositol-1(or 4)-monophosphatase
MVCPLQLSHPFVEPLIASMREAGHVAQILRAKGLKILTKDNGSPVSDADLEADRILSAALQRLTPDVPILSEEQPVPACSLGAMWSVDPIDGTRAFVAGGSDWCLSVALVDKGAPVLGLLYAPDTDDLYVAQRGFGAWHHGTRLRVPLPSSPLRVNGPSLMVGHFRSLIPQAEETPRLRSLALRIAMVATGAVDVALASHRASDWDLAAAVLLVQEAGGLVVDAAGAVPQFVGHTEGHGALVASLASEAAQHARALSQQVSKR